ncbi:MAG TPA: DUF5777 family beta-barrel protein [Vicinamibacterales bacterium]|jgi:hypothetical protein
MTFRSIAVRASGALALTLAVAHPAAAQDPASPPPAPPAAAQPAAPPADPQAVATQPAASDPDVRLDPLQPDFALAALPTTLRMPEHKLAFRLTHRFTRSLGEGNFGDLLDNFFGFDSAALIGLELRYGLLPGTQVGIHRTSDKTIQIFGQQNLSQQKPDGRPLGIDVIATYEGLDNMKAQKMGALGVLVSRKVGRVAALYAEPIVVFNSKTNPNDPSTDTDTGMIGLGTRLRIRPTTYLVGEITPRFAGYRPGVDQMSFGLEARAGGHTFQLNFSNGFGTTLGQIARGGIDNSSWFIGFNLSRKFF